MRRSNRDSCSHHRRTCDKISRVSCNGMISEEEWARRRRMIAKESPRLHKLPCLQPTAWLRDNQFPRTARLQLNGSAGTEKWIITFSSTLCSCRRTLQSYKHGYFLQWTTAMVDNRCNNGVSHQFRSGSTQVCTWHIGIRVSNTGLPGRMASDWRQPNTNWIRY